MQSMKDDCDHHAETLRCDPKRGLNKRGMWREFKILEPLQQVSILETRNQGTMQWMRCLVIMTDWSVRQKPTFILLIITATFLPRRWSIATTWITGIRRDRLFAAGDLLPGDHHMTYRKTFPDSNDYLVVWWLSRITRKSVRMWESGLWSVKMSERTVKQTLGRNCRN